LHGKEFRCWWERKEVFFERGVPAIASERFGYTRCSPFIKGQREEGEKHKISHGKARDSWNSRGGDQDSSEV